LKSSSRVAWPILPEAPVIKICFLLVFINYPPNIRFIVGEIIIGERKTENNAWDLRNDRNDDSCHFREENL
jgi:hypothetical protein